MRMNFRTLLTIICVLLYLVTSITYAKTTKLVGEKLSFEQYKITVPFNVKLPIIALDLVTSEQFPGDEIVVIGEDEQHKMQLAVYTFDQSQAD